MIKEEVFVTYADDVVVEDTGVDGVWILLSKEKVCGGDLMKSGDGL